MPTCRAMALTDKPWRCKSRIMTSSPSLITPASRRSLGDSVRPPAIPGMPRWPTVTKTAEISNVTSGENAGATHTIELAPVQKDEERPHVAAAVLHHLDVGLGVTMRSKGYLSEASAPAISCQVSS